ARAEADESASGHDELHTHPAGAVAGHRRHAALALGEALRDGTEGLLGPVDGLAFHRLAGLAGALLRDDLRLADRELEALTTHLLDQDGQRELTTALDLPRVRALGRQNAERDVADELLVEPVLDLARGDLVALAALARERGGVDTDRHRDRGVVD